MEYYYLEIIEGIDKGKRYPLPDGAVSLGRSHGNTIALNTAEKSVSSHHAIIYKMPGRILLQDMQSTNGTYVNDEKIAERELAANDRIRFGRLGPQLLFVVSDRDLDADAPPVAAHVVAQKPPTGSTSKNKTFDEQLRPPMRPLVDEADRVPFGNQDGFMTMEMERKLLNKRIDPQEMQRLMKDGKKVEKLVNRGNLSQTQSHMLLSAYSAGKKMRVQAWVVLGSVVAVSLVVILFFGIRMLQYKRLVDKGMSLEQQLDGIDQRIAKMNRDPDANKTELRALIEKYEKTKSQLVSVKGEIREDDFQKFYTDTTEMFINDIMVRFGETDYHIPPQMTERVKHHIGVYSGGLKPTIKRYMKRKERYFPMILEVFKEKKLPVELAYVSMLESGFNPNALSQVGARGLWQFMPKTGRSYGLKVTDDNDERLDPQRATYAAAEYFRDLIAIFGGKRSVMLAMAAYNAGEGRVMGALKKIDDPMRDRDFWYIYRMGYLAEETNEYIPRILALMIISEHPARYGMDTRGMGDTGLTAENDFVEVNLPGNRRSEDPFSGYEVTKEQGSTVYRKKGYSDQGNSLAQ
jgi:pSer/pThr/pTyr-binding forkhead associated (FHA) protein